MNTFVDSFFRTKGRLNRKGYMLRLVILLVLIFFCQIVMSQLANAQGNLRYAVFFFLIAQFILVIGNLFIAVRRFHDLNLSGYWAIIIGVLSATGVISPSIEVLTGLTQLGITIFLISIKGSKGENKYGTDPLELE